LWNLELDSPNSFLLVLCLVSCLPHLDDDDCLYLTSTRPSRPRSAPLLSDRTDSTIDRQPVSPFSLQSLVSIMATFRKAVLAVIVKSLMRGKSLIQAILAYWISPLAISEVKGLPPTPLTPNKSIEEFLKQAEVAFLNAINSDDLVRLSAGLKKQYLDKLQNDMECMLPSYSHQLPFGDESGRYLALDVGGSTLRVALVELSGLDANGKNHSRIISIRNFSIDKPIKDLEGVAFFDWMASKIIETVSTDEQSTHGTDKPLSVALAWSFPIESVLSSQNVSIVQVLWLTFVKGKHL
jgi:hypothetical protein